MTATPDPFLVDTNVLIRWANDRAEHHDLCLGSVELLTAAGGTPSLVPQNLVEAWNVLTRPTDRNGFGLSLIHADEALTQMEQSFNLIEDTPTINRIWRRLVVEVGVRGVQVHDARLAACMRIHGIERILTFNTDDFARYAGIEPLHPRDVAVP